MLKVDLNQGRYGIVEHVTKNCSAFGNVRTVRLFLGKSPTAVVEMSSAKETEELALQLCGELVGNTVFIALAPLTPLAQDTIDFDWSADTAMQN